MQTIEMSKDGRLYKLAAHPRTGIVKVFRWSEDLDDWIWSTRFSVQQIQAALNVANKKKSDDADIMSEARILRCNEAAKRHKAGESAIEIGFHFGISKQAVYVMLTEAKIPIEERRATKKENNRIKAKIRKEKKQVTARKVSDYRKEGYSFGKIGKMLGVSQSYVWTLDKQFKGEL